MTCDAHAHRPVPRIRPTRAAGPRQHRPSVRDADGRLPGGRRLPGPFRPAGHRPGDDRAGRRAQRPQRPRRAPQPGPRGRGGAGRRAAHGQLHPPALPRRHARHGPHRRLVRVRCADAAHPGGRTGQAPPHPDHRRIDLPQADQRLTHTPAGR
ncbi:hypothetical protein SGPA1_30142 [Streptomyces misionensis JCM 4497]